MTHYHKLSLLDAQRFVSGGKAVFTMRNSKTGRRFTFKVNLSKDKKIYFVGVMTGTDNNVFRYLGFVRAENMSRFIHGRKSTISVGAPSSVYATWLFSHLYGKRPNLMSAEIWHEGKCGCCGRRLTDSESITRGLGPICVSR